MQTTSVSAGPYANLGYLSRIADEARMRALGSGYLNLCQHCGAITDGDHRGHDLDDQLAA